MDILNKTMDESAMVGNVLVSSLTNKKGGKIGTLFGGGKNDGKSMLVVPMSLYSSSTSFQLPENNDDLEDDDFESDSDEKNDNDDDLDEENETLNQVVDDDIYDSLLELMEEKPESNLSPLVSQESIRVEPSNVSMLVEEIEPTLTSAPVRKYASLSKSLSRSHAASKGKRHSKKHASNNKYKAKKSEKKSRNLTKKKNGKKTKRKGTKKHGGILQGIFN